VAKVSAAAMSNMEIIIAIGIERFFCSKVRNAAKIISRPTEGR